MQLSYIAAMHVGILTRSPAVARIADHTAPVVNCHTFGNWSGSHPGS